MKQRRIKELAINHYEQGSSVYYTPSRTEEYAAVLAQAEAHQDLRFHTEINGVETLVILLWESVISVNATYETAEVPAPTDTICEGAEPAGRLVVTPTEPLPSLILNNEGGSCTVSAGFGITATFDGVELTEEQLWTGMTFEVVGATHDQGSWVLPVDCDALSVTYTTVYTYEGETCSVTVTQSISHG